MGLHHFLMNRGLGSPGSVTRSMARRYRAMKQAWPELEENTILRRVYCDRIAAQTLFGGPEQYKERRRNPELIDTDLFHNTDIFSIIKCAILIEIPAFFKPGAPADRFKVLDQVIAENLDANLLDWRMKERLPKVEARVNSATGETTDSSSAESHSGNEVRVTTNLNTRLAPRFDFSEKDIQRFGTTFLLVGRWQGFVITEKQAADWTLGFARAATRKTSDDKVAVQYMFAPLQSLLMARRSTDFCSIQEEPAFSRSGQENFLRLCDAFRREGDVGFYEQWRRIFGGEMDVDIPKYPIISYVGGPGDSKDTAVLLSASDPQLMILAEYWYLAYHFGRKNEQWSLVRQALLPRALNEGRMYDLIEIDLTDGGRRSVYFDISALPY